MISPKHGLISIFARHPVAANLLMALMILSGIFAITQLNVQFLPDAPIKKVKVEIVWQGASTEDVERSITSPVEQELKNVEYLKEMSSVSRNGLSVINLEFTQNADMGDAIERVRDRISQVRNLPTDSEPPIIERNEFFEPVARVIIYGPDNLTKLRPVVHQMERQLLDKGIAKVTVTGLPEEEMAIQIPSQTLAELHLSLNQVADKIASRSKDLPAGEFGGSTVTRQIRSLAQQRDINGFKQLPVITDAEGRILRLGDIAIIERRAQDEEPKVYYKGQAAIEMTLLRTANASTLKSADILHQWLKQQKPDSDIKIAVYDEKWQYVEQRIQLLLKNGLGGLILILCILFFFLNRQTAFWIAMGIPASFLAACAALYFLGGSINMISLFAFIMTLGIIVDDTIVVGEEALTLRAQGEKAIAAVETAAHKMLAPIMASSLTTIFAFLPLMLVGGVIGKLLFSIPLIVICVIMASIIECFLVLPGHLHHSFRRNKHKPASKIRKKIDAGFLRFREEIFRPVVKNAIDFRWVTLSLALAAGVISIGLLMTGRVHFTFFPAPEASMLHAEVAFTASSPPKEVQSFMHQVSQALVETSGELSKSRKSLVVNSVLFENQKTLGNERGEQYAALAVELLPSDDRSVTNKEFIRTWRSHIVMPPGVESFSILEPRGGPPGRDIDIEISGAKSSVLKQVANKLEQSLGSYQGVSDVTNDMPYGQEQLIYELNTQGKSLGLTIDDVGKQIRAAFNGQLVQIFHEPLDEIEVRVMLPDNERSSSASLEKLPLVTKDGESVSLGSVVDLKVQRGLDVVRHTDTNLTIHITAEVDNNVANANKILANLHKTVVPDLKKEYGVQVHYAGRAEEQAETLRDMSFGVVLALCLIYIVLAWVFSSYGWPIIVMLAIPFGLIGAIVGHLLMGLDMTILSLFGFFGLSGIVINDSIILLSRYKQLRGTGMGVRTAIVEASCQRLRPVLLTSVTTIAGLSPILFEKSLQAQFLIPMAASITFGLAFATILILLVIPAFLSVYERLLVGSSRSSRG